MFQLVQKVAYFKPLRSALISTVNLYSQVCGAFFVIVVVEPDFDTINCFGLKIRYFGDVLRGLYPLFGESEPDDAVKDNAAGAVARMIMAHQESVPLNQVSILHILFWEDVHKHKFCG